MRPKLYPCYYIKQLKCYKAYILKDNTQRLTVKTSMR